MKSILRYILAGIQFFSTIIIMAYYLTTPYSLVGRILICFVMSGLFSSGCYFLVEGVKLQFRK